jgi:hypothetical protein
LVMALNRVGITAVQCPVQLLADAANAHEQLLNLWAGSVQHSARAI